MSNKEIKVNFNNIDKTTGTIKINRHLSEFREDLWPKKNILIDYRVQKIQNTIPKVLDFNKGLILKYQIMIIMPVNGNLNYCVNPITYFHQKMLNKNYILNKISQDQWVFKIKIKPIFLNLVHSHLKAFKITFSNKPNTVANWHTLKNLRIIYNLKPKVKFKI